LLAKWRPEKHELLHFIADFFDRNLWIKQSRASFVECLVGGGVGQKFPNDEKNFRIFHGIRSHEGVCYPENEDAIYKQKYT
jgi:hypothetical protein